MRILIVTAPYYRAVVAEMEKGAKAVCAARKARVEVVSVPGALEIPAAIAIAERTQQYDGYIALGCVLRGETAHFEVVAGESARGLMDLSLYSGAAIGNGILTVNTMAQAKKRASLKHGNKGAEAARAVLALIDLQKKLSTTL